MARIGEGVRGEGLGLTADKGLRLHGSLAAVGVKGDGVGDDGGGAEDDLLVSGEISLHVIAGLKEDRSLGVSDFRVARHIALVDGPGKR